LIIWQLSTGKRFSSLNDARQEPRHFAEHKRLETVALELQGLFLMSETAQEVAWGIFEERLGRVLETMSPQTMSILNDTLVVVAKSASGDTGTLHFQLLRYGQENFRRLTRGLFLTVHCLLFSVLRQRLLI
jgi:hypothetical protein